MKSQPRLLDTWQIVGFIVSAGISIALILTRQDTVASVTLGLVLAILTQLFDLQLRHTSTEERLLEANALSKTLYGNPWLLTHIQQIVDDYQSIQSGWFDLFKSRASESIAECRNSLHSLAEGRMFANPRSPYDFGVGAFEKAKKSLKGVDAGDLAYWRSTYGEKYLLANIMSVRRGIEVTRVFVQSETALQEYADVIQNQHQAGIKVYVAQLEDIPRELNRDYLIVDDRVLVDVELASDRRQLQRRISIDPVEVEQMIQRFELLLKYAIKLEDTVGTPK